MLDSSVRPLPGHTVVRVRPGCPIPAARLTPRDAVRPETTSDGLSSQSRCVTIHNDICAGLPARCFVDVLPGMRGQNVLFRVPIADGCGR